MQLRDSLTNCLISLVSSAQLLFLHVLRQLCSEGQSLLLYLCYSDFKTNWKFYLTSKMLLTVYIYSKIALTVLIDLMKALPVQVLNVENA